MKEHFTKLHKHKKQNRKIKLLYELEENGQNVDEASRELEFVNALKMHTKRLIDLFADIARFQSFLPNA